MKVAIFASAFAPHVGGVEELVRQLCLQYRSMDVDAYVITNQWPRMLKGHETVDGIDVYRFPMRVPVGGMKATLSYYATSGRIQRDIVNLVRSKGTDLLHIQCVSGTALYACHCKQALGIPLVTTLQGELTMDAGKLFQTSRFARSFMTQSLQLADHVTGCSAQTLREAEDFLGEPFESRGSVIFNGVRLADFQNAQTYHHDRPYILGIGRHVPQKGFDVLIKAYADARDRFDHPTDLILAGDGVEHWNLVALTRSLNIADHVLMPGSVNHDVAVQMFRGSEFFVLSSRHEPFGIVNLEAMAAGKTVIATDVGGVAEYVTHEQNGLLIPAENVEAMSQAMVRLTNDEALRNRMQREAAGFVTQFDWSRIADAYAAIYRQLIG